MSAGPGFPIPPLNADARRLAEGLHRAMRGKLNATGTVTLAAGAGTTLIADERIGPLSVICLMPLTASAAAAAGTTWVAARGNASATLAHAVDPATDRRFGYVVIG